MAAYLIADTVVTDAPAYDQYRSRVAPLVARFGGRFPDAGHRRRR
jgi:uncharacterized protein (DUF1330 family)